VPTPRRPRADVSNTQTARASKLRAVASEGFSVKKARAEAQKNGVGPFVINDFDDEGTTIEISYPSTNRLMDAADAERVGDARGAVTAMCGDVAERIFEIIGDDRVEVLNDLLLSMRKHFGIPEPGE
jgi:hypothetical protein